MAHPQIGFFDETIKHAYFLEYRLQTQNRAQLLDTLQRALQCEVGPETLSVQIAFGADCWQDLNPEWMPQGLVPFTAINGLHGMSALANQGDIWFRVQGIDVSQVFDQAMKIHRLMKTIAELTLEQSCFDYYESMDLIGFEDGSANPATQELKEQAALIPDDKAGAGGCFVLGQKWVHDLDKWQEIPVACQEKIVGRNKETNEELEGDTMPADSHISCTDLTVDGEAMKIYRRSVPFGTVLENGLYFLAFACDLKRISVQLDSMYGLTEAKVIDQLLHYSQAVSSAYWFMPSQDDLARILENN